MPAAYSSLKSAFMTALLAGSAVLPLAVSSDPELMAQEPQTPQAPAPDPEKLEALLSIVRNNYVDPLPADRWNAIFDTARDRLNNKKETLTDTMNKALKDLDPHSQYLSPEEAPAFHAEANGELASLGIRFSVGDTYVTMSPVKGENAEKAGIQDDDILLRINGKRLSKDSKERLKQIVSLPHVPGVTVTLTVQHRGETRPRNVQVTSSTVVFKPVTTSKIGKDIGYIRLDHFSYRLEDKQGRPLLLKNGTPVEDGASLFMNALTTMRQEMSKDMKDLILDLRDNPGGDLEQAVKIAAAFLDKGTVITSTKYRHGNENMIYKSASGDLAKDLRVIVLVNDGSASASEVVAGALQDNNRAIIMGGQTFGKGTIKQNLTLLDGSILIYTMGRYYTPGGHSIQISGITPDISVTLPKNMAFKQEREADLYKALPPPDAVRDPHQTMADCSPVGSVNVKKLQKPMVVARDVPDYPVICAVSYLRTHPVAGVTFRPLSMDRQLALPPAPR